MLIWKTRAPHALLLIVSMQLVADAQAPPRDLTEMSLEDLMNTQVTSVSKKEQMLSKTGAAVYVITQEDIRRSGATTIPDLLRMVPGVNVARVDHNNWAIGIRGFSDVYANKVLVLIDGRSVYHPIFSGVLWHEQDVPLEDIERVEIIRGPGGTVWGANAVNGVINIRTKSAKATEGALISAGAGSKEAAEGLVQYGGKIGNSGAYRAFGRFSNIGRSDNPGGAPGDDTRSMWHGGFRSDSDLSRHDTLTVQGEILRAHGAETLTAVTSLTPPRMGTFRDPISDDSGNILARWTHTYANGSDTSLQIYDDKSHVSEDGVQDWVNIVDFEFEHHLSAGRRNDVVWGLNYRSAANRFAGNDLLSLNPLERTDRLFSVFVQDEITLTHSLSLTLGSKFERNAYTGYENEPSAQLVWTPTPRQTFWGSAAKAIRQPSNIDAGIQVAGSLVPLGPAGFGVVTAFGNPNIKVEELHDLEAGYRAQLSRRLSLDLTAFRSYYKHLQTNEPQAAFFTFTPVPHLVIPMVYDNLAHARDFGAELFATWNVTERWKVSPGLSFLNMSVTRDAASEDPIIELTPGYSPERQFQVRSFMNLPHNLEWDHTLGYTGRLSNGDIPGYVRLDTRLGWRIGESLELSVVGQNLLQPRHAEFPDIHYVNHMQDQRSVFGKITWRF